MAISNLEIIIGLQDRTGGALGGITSKLQTIGKVALGAALGGITALGAGIIAIAAKAIPAASDLNEAMNATSVVFGDAAGVVQKFGETASENAGLSASAFNQMAAQTGAMLTNFGFDVDGAADETIKLTQRAADMASIFNTDVNESLTALQAGLRGETEPLRRFGVSLSQASVEARAVEMGLEKVNGEFTAQQLTMARLSLIYEQTDKIAGDFVNTSDGLANSARIAAARWENFQAKLGKLVLPIVQKVQQVFMRLGERILPTVLDVLTPLAGALEGLVDRFLKWFDIIVKVISNQGLGGLFVIFEDGSTYLEGFFELLGMSEGAARNLSVGIINLINDIRNFLQPIIDAVSQFVSWKDILIALGIAIAAVVIPAILSVASTLLPIIAVVAAVIGIVALLRNAWESNFMGIREGLTTLWENYGRPIFEAMQKWLGENIPIALQKLSDFWNNVLLPAIQTVETWLRTVWFPWVTGVLYPLIAETLTAALQKLSDFWTNTLQPAIAAVWAFIQDYLVPLFTALAELLEVTVAVVVGNLAVLWADTLKPALETVWDFIDKNIIPIFADVVDIIDVTLRPVLEWLSNFLGGAFKTAWDAIIKVVEYFISLINKAIEAMEKLKPPPIFDPGSPTPFERGIRGINSALQDLNRMHLPQLQANLTGMGAGGSNTSNQFTLNMYPSGPVNVAQDFHMLQALARI